MANCVLHPGSKAILTLYGKNYCQKCKDEIGSAVKDIDAHVQPKACFIWYKNAKEGWTPITGTGCAHWVAHEFSIHKGSKGAQCLAGYPYRVPDLISGKTKVELKDVKVDDFYVTTDGRHMGVVIKVDPPKKEGDPPEITIKHDSSAQHGVATDSFDKRFKSSGLFYR
jgi:hypothetical protein